MNCPAVSWEAGLAAFIFSGALAFVLYQALAFAHMPSPTRDWFRISNITISFEDSSARWARLMLRAGIVFVVLACVLLIHEVAGPADVISRNRVSVLVGFFFGPLFAIWVNAIFAHPPGEDLTRGQVIAGIGLVLMFILGSLGNETGRLIQQYANKLQSLKLAGAELSFSEKSKSDRDNKLAGALQLAGGAHVTGSAALGYLSQLDVIIKRDADYLRHFGAPDGDLDRAASFVSQTFKKPLTCLASWYQWTADTPSIRRHARAFARIFRDLGALDDEDRIRKQIIQESLSIASDVAALEVRRKWIWAAEIFPGVLPAAIRRFEQLRDRARPIRRTGVPGGKQEAARDSQIHLRLLLRSRSRQLNSSSRRAPFSAVSAASNRGLIWRLHRPDDGRSGIVRGRGVAAAVPGSATRS